MVDLNELFEKVREAGLRIENLFERHTGGWACFLWSRTAAELDPPFKGDGDSPEGAIESALSVAAGHPIAEPPAGPSSIPRKRMLADDLDELL